MAFAVVESHVETTLFASLKFYLNFEITTFQLELDWRANYYPYSTLLISLSFLFGFSFLLTVDDECHQQSRNLMTIILQ